MTIMPTIMRRKAGIKMIMVDLRVIIIIIIAIITAIIIVIIIVEVIAQVILLRNMIHVIMMRTPIEEEKLPPIPHKPHQVHLLLTHHPFIPPM
jgi:hypothetical protein